MRHLGLGRGIARWRKKAAKDRRQEYRRRYLERRVEQLQQRAAEREEVVADIFSAIAHGRQVDLLEKIQQPPPASTKAPTEARVSDPRHVAAAKAYSNAMDRTSKAQAKWSAARQDADADKAALAEARSKWVPVLKAAGPSISMGAPKDDPASVRYLEAQAELTEAQNNLYLTAAIEDVLRGDVAEAESKERAAWEEYNNATFAMLQDDSPPAAHSADAMRTSAEAAINNHAAREASYNDCTAKQIARAGEQGLTTMKIYEALAHRNREEARIGRAALEAAEVLGPDGDGVNSALEAGLKNMEELRNRSSMPMIAADAANRHGNISAETVLAWFNQYDSNGYFKLDERGAGLKEWILSEDDLLFSLLQYLKKEKRLNVSKVVEFINDKLLTKAYTSMDDAKMKDVYGIVKPVSRGLVHSWMQKMDCVFDRATQTYYTDGHNKPEVIADRLVYFAELRRLSLRQPLWVQVPLADVPAEALETIEHNGLPCEVYKYEREGVDFIEFHVDRLGREGEAGGKGTSTDRGAFDIVRKKSENGGNFSVRFKAEADSPCRAGHEGVCFCHLPAWHMGQDECIFKAYLREGKEWVVAGVRGLRKKTEGPGIMVSAFQDEIRGFGFEMTSEELARVNAFRSVNGRPALKDTPGTRFLEYGKNKDGYWNYDMFAEQCVDVMDCFEVLYPGWQLVMEVDHSSGHAKYREDGLHVGNMNVKWGGVKGGEMRDTKVTAACLGPNPATVVWIGKRYDCKLKPGDVQHATFQAGDPPPFYDLDAEPKSKKRGRKVKGPSVGKGKNTWVSEPTIGYEGKPKGIRQMLWERGLWEGGMTGRADPKTGKNCYTVLGSCPDFRAEKSALQHVVESRGHILIMSPKCHPELAGVGVEYSWGKSKLEFRRKINDEDPKHLKENVLKALSTDGILTLERVRRFARRTRDYRRTYALLASKGDDLEELKRAHGGAEGYKLIEKMCAACKTHRNIVDMEVAFLNSE